jgi:hypothetical protein
MRWRKRLTFLLLFAMLAALAGAGWVAYQLLFPLDVSRQVVAGFEEKLAGVEVRVGSARLRLLGGIAVTDLTLVRRDDPTGTPFLSVPKAVIYHDKERLAQGKLAFRKIELHQPLIRVERSPDGRLNLAGVLGPTDPAEPVPTVVAYQGRITFLDRKAGLPKIEWQDAHLTVLNDPVDRLAVRMNARSALTGPVRVELLMLRADDAVGGTVELSALPVGREQADVLAAFAPDLAEHAHRLRGAGSVAFTFLRSPGQTPEWRHVAKVELHKGRFEHPKSPLPALDDIELKLRCEDGRVTVERCQARAGESQLDLTLELLPETPTSPDAHAEEAASVVPPAPPCESGFAGLESRLRKLDLNVRQLQLSSSVLAKLPPNLAKLQQMFSPAGPVSVNYSFSRQGRDWQKRCVIRPEGMTGVYEKFCYPLANVRGTLDQLITSARVDRLKIDLSGNAAGQPVSVKGRIEGEGPDPEVDLVVTVSNLNLDEGLIAALPEKYRPLARSFHPSGRGDAVALVKQTLGARHFNNTFTVRFRDAAVNYDVFPVPVFGVGGTLIITTGAPATPDRPSGDSWEFRDFRGEHAGGIVRVAGRNDPSPAGDLLTVDVEGDNVPLDADMQAALGKLGLASTWKAIRPSGRMNFFARVRRTDPPGDVRTAAATNVTDAPLDVTLRLSGPTIFPDFFEYKLDGVKLLLRYSDDQVDLTQFSARHGPSELTIPRTKIYVRPGGGVWAGMSDLSLNPLVTDAAFLAALPPELREGVRELNLRGPARFDARRFVVDVPPDPPASLTSVGGAKPPDPPVGIYWEAGLTLAGASMTTGVDWSQIHGQAGCVGESRGGQLGRLVGDTLFSQAVVAKQPLRDVHTHFETDPKSSDILMLSAMRAKLFGGDVIGTGRVWLDGPTRYNLKLTGMQIDLKELAKQNKLGPDVQLDGLAKAEIYLTNHDEHGKPTVMHGNGSVNVEKGSIAKLPFLLDLLKVLNLRAPDRTAFEEMHANLSIKGERITVSELDLLGNAISLGGEGELNFDGSDLHFNFYAVWSRVGQMLPGPVRDLPAAISRNLFKIEARGQAGGKLEFKKEAVPFLVDPIRRLFERLKGKPGTAAESPFSAAP